jgi:Fic family protein
MERSFFTPGSPGKPMRVKKNKWAFCPDPLPTALDPDWRIFTALCEAEREIGRIEGALASFSDFAPLLLQKIFLFQEATAAFTIEKTNVSVESHFLSIVLETDEKRLKPDCISLYIDAYNNGLSYLDKSLPPSLDLILMLYTQLFQSDATLDGEPAGFREKAGEPASAFSLTGSELEYIPPPVPQMKTALYALDKRFRHGTNIPQLVDISLIYYQLLATRPFVKGNMAIASLLSDLLLARFLEARTVPIPIAPFFKANPDDFSRCFFHLIKTGDWVEWISFFLKGIARQSIKARKTVSAVSAIHEDYRKRIESERVSVALSQLVDDIFLNPFMTVNYASRLARVTFRAAQFNVDKLADLGIIKETTGRRRNRVYIAPDIIEIYNS